MTRVVAFSDLHASGPHLQMILQAAERADLVIGAGDFCNMRQGLGPVMAALAPIAPKAVYVPGNAETADELRAATGALVLHGQSAERAGLKLFGLGYAVPVTPFGDWSCDLSEAEAAEALAALGLTDILITHAPPKGAADSDQGGVSRGSTAIRDAILRGQPRLALCGHIHASWGARVRLGATDVVNLGPSPVLFDL
jgi:Icc-related predicted phosphoesterase